MAINDDYLGVGRRLIPLLLVRTPDSMALARGGRGRRGLVRRLSSIDSSLFLCQLSKS